MVHGHDPLSIGHGPWPRSMAMAKGDANGHGTKRATSRDDMHAVVRKVASSAHLVDRVLHTLSDTHGVHTDATQLNSSLSSSSMHTPPHASLSSNWGEYDTRHARRRRSARPHILHAIHGVRCTITALMGRACHGMLIVIMYMHALLTHRAGRRTHADEASGKTQVMSDGSVRHGDGRRVGEALCNGHSAQTHGLQTPPMRHGGDWLCMCDVFLTAHHFAQR